MQTTTSKYAFKDNEKHDVDKFVHEEATKWVNFIRRNGKVDKKDRPTPQTIRIDFWQREWFIEMPLALIYRLFRVLFVSVWFYFSPFIAMSLQFMIPFSELVSKNNDATAA